MKSIGALCVLLLLAAPGAAQDEPAAYRKVREAREEARRFGTTQAFEAAARTYLAEHDGSERAAVVHLWAGDLLKDADPRAAYAHYVRAGTPDAAARADGIAFRFEAPPAIEAERWIGEPVDPRAGDGTVKLFVFFSLTHPQTAKLLPRLEAHHAQLFERGLRVAGVAAVVDDHANQRPETLAKRLLERRLPFPVAIDRQDPPDSSRTLRAYRGSFVPWAVCLDRYGRIAWLGGCHSQGNAATTIREQIEKLLAEPTLDELAAAVRRGDEDALETLAWSVRTKATVPALLGALDDSPLREQGLEVLRGLLPEDAPKGDLAELRDYWRKNAARLRYEYARDRLVAR